MTLPDFDPAELFKPWEGTPKPRHQPRKGCWSVVIDNGHARVRPGPIPRGESRKLYKRGKFRIVQRFFGNIARWHKNLSVSFHALSAEYAPPQGPHVFMGGFSPEDAQQAVSLPEIHSMNGTFDRWREQAMALTTPWGQRENKAVFRAYIHRLPGRLALCELSAQHPDELDAKLAIRDSTHKAKIWRDEDIPGRLIGEKMSLEEQAGYRYLVACCGWTAMYWKMLSGSLMLNIEEAGIPYLTWRNHFLTPHEHYVPVAINNIIDTIHRLREDDDTARKTMQQGKRRMLELGVKETYSYAYKMLRFYQDNWS